MLVDFVHAEGNIDAQLYNPAGALLADSVSSSDDESLSYTATVDGDIYLRISLVNDTGSEPGNPYELDVAISGLSCIADGFEPNDSQGGAATLSQGSTPGLTACGDEDWYQLLLGASQQLTIDLDFLHSEGNIDANLVDAGGSVLASSDSLTDGESLVYTSASSATVFLQVELTTDLGVAPGNSYDLDVSVGVPSCAPDAEEPNDDIASPSTLASGDTLGLTACDSDDDWYAIALADGQEADVAVFFSHAEGNINATLRDAGGTILDSASSGTDDEFLAHTASGAETIFLQVELFADSGSLPGNGYSVSLTINAPACATDAAEPNDSSGNPFSVTSGTYAGLSACEEDEDWYALDVTDGDTIDLDLAFSHAEGNIDVALFDGAGSLLLAQGNSTSDDESLSHAVTADDTLLIQVTLNGDTGSVPGNNYSMTVAGVVPQCIADGFEPNDDVGAAANVADDFYPGLTACDADDDWYAIDLIAGDELTLDVLFSHAEGNIDLELFDATGSSLLDGSNSTSNDENITYTAPADETVTLRLDLVADTGSVPGNSYSMQVDITGLACVDDGLEDNDSIASADGVTPGTETGLVSCPSDADWYSIDLVSGEQLVVDVLFTHADGDIDLGIYDAGESLQAASSSPTDNEQAVFVAPSDGPYYINVGLTEDFGLPGNGYDMTVAVGAASCVTDLFEPNDALADAAALGTGLTTGLAVCPTDNDFYAIDLAEGVVLDVTAFFQHAEGDIDLYLLDDTGSDLAEAVSVSNDESFSFTTIFSGVHILEVDLFSDTGSVPGNTYSLQVSTATQPCIEDALEDDDELAEATEIANGTYADLSVCPSDDDFFLFNANAADAITIDVAFSHAEGNVDIFLLDATLAVLASSESLTDDEQITHTATTDEPLFLQIVLTEDFGLVDGAEYSATVAGLTLTCVEDALEPNNAFLDATPALDGDTFEDLRVCEVDLDYFTIDLLNGDVLTVDAIFEVDEGDIDLNVYDAGFTFLASGNSADDDEQVVWAASQDGVYYLEVQLAADEGVLPGNTYDLEFGVAAGFCAEDAQEPNNSLGQGPALSDGLLAGLTACSDEDWFSVDLLQGENLSVDAIFEHAEGDIDIELYDDGGALQVESSSASDDESIVFPASGAGTYWLRVLLFADLGPDAGNTYDLDVSIDTINCAADAFEPNDSQGSPVSLVTGLYPDLSACPIDTDWFNVGAINGQIIDVQAVFDHAEGDIDLRLYDPTGAEVAASTSATDDEQVTWNVVLDGQYTFEVALVLDTGSIDGNPYDLNVSVGDALCFLDDFEPNNDIAEPVPVLEQQGTYPSIASCEGDPDLFAFDLEAGDVFDVSALFPHAEGDIDIFLYDQTFTEVDAAVSVTDNETLSYGIVDTGTHFLEVFMTADAGATVGNRYAIEWTTGGFGSCADDEFEPNDLEFDARRMPPGTAAGLSVCEDDSDWYEVVGFGGNAMNIDLTFSHAEGDIDMELYDDALVTEDLAVSSSDDESISFTPADTGLHFLEVYLALDSGPVEGNTYTLDYSFGTPACGFDQFEGNNSLEPDLDLLPDGLTERLVACTTDDDYYRVLVLAGQTLTIDVLFSHSDGDIDVDLLDGNSSLLDDSFSVTDNEQVTYTAVTSGFYYLDVYLPSDSGDPGNDYSVLVTVN